MLSTFIGPTSSTILPGSTIKKRESSPGTTKKVSAFIHWKRQKLRKETEKLVHECALERSKREEEVRRKQTEDKQFFQNLEDEIGKLQQKKAQLERLQAKEFEELRRKVAPRQEQNPSMRANHEQVSPHHTSHRRSPASGSSHGMQSRVTNGRVGNYPGTYHHHSQNPMQTPQNAPLPMSSVQLGNAHYPMGAAPSHLDNSPGSGRKRTRSRSPSPQLVKMYSQGNRPSTPRGSSMSPAAHAVSSLNLPPGVNHNHTPGRNIYDHPNHVAYANAGLANFHNGAPSTGRYGGNAGLHAGTTTVEQLVASSPYRHHSSGVGAQSQSAAVFHQNRQSLSQYSLPGREHAKVHSNSNLNLAANASNVAAHAQLKGRWNSGHGGLC